MASVAEWCYKRNSPLIVPAATQRVYEMFDSSPWVVEVSTVFRGLQMLRRVLGGFRGCSMGGELASWWG